MRHLLRFVFLLLVLHSTPVFAGVVEDAEEELRKLREAQGQVQRAPSYSPPSFPSSTTASPTRPRRSPAASPTDTASTSTTSEVTGHRAGKMQSSPEQVEELGKRPRVITHEDKKGYFFSFLLLLLFVVFIALATLFGRRIETEE